MRKLHLPSTSMTSKIGNNVINPQDANVNDGSGVLQALSQRERSLGRMNSIMVNFHEVKM